MKPKSIERLSVAMEKVINELQSEKVGWLEAKGMNLTNRETQALRAGMLDGWNAAINYIQLHNLT